MNHSGITSPLDITPRMSNSNSPRGQTSNLTSALQEAGASGLHTSTNPQYLHQMDFYNGNGQSSDMSRNDMFGGSFYGNGARPILMGNRQRRESNNAGSYMGGMSWGANSINGGDWVRDDVLMAGTSPSAFQQPSSFQSSSYLPKMEASFFKDYWCCNLCHASLHDLMEHMEQVHGGQAANVLQAPPVTGPSNLNFARQPPMQNPQPTHRSTGGAQTSQPHIAQVTKGFQTSTAPTKTALATIHDDPLDTMDFDEPSNFGILQGMPNAGVPQQPFRSQAAAAATAGQPFSLLSSNPTVSSVNTPTLSTHPLAQSKHTPESSIPSTPHGLNMNFDAPLDMFNGMNGVPDMSNMQFTTDNFDFNNLDYGLPSNLGSMTINDPAKQLSSKGNVDAAQMQFNYNNTFGLDDLSAQAHFPGGVPSSALGFPGHEEKKYKCPVIGCEKAYKNQNGLKYHKQHGHTSQKLKHNEDGSFSIVDPLTSVPYPGTIGMEKEKPYRCEMCGKRYKNLNGLKYHRQHSPPCNPELAQNKLHAAMPNGLISLQQLQQNVHSGLT